VLEEIRGGSSVPVEEVDVEVTDSSLGGGNERSGEDGVVFGGRGVGASFLQRLGRDNRVGGSLRFLESLLVLELSVVDLRSENALELLSRSSGVDGDASDDG